MGRPMTYTEHRAFAALTVAVEKARTILEEADAGAPDKDEDLRVACARLDNWLLENEGRWTL